jgi:bifunctional non-homologous end joining protein LigD
MSRRLQEGMKASTKLRIHVSHPDKVFWPKEGYTKLDLIRFYDSIFPRLSPFVRNRLLALERCPDGMEGDCFFQKEAPQGMPPRTPTKRIEHDHGVTNYVIGGRRETQLALVNLGCIAVHVWGSRARAPRKPDWVCFDLDPDSGKMADAAKAGLRLKEALDALGLSSYPKTSGGRGLHVFIPIRIGPATDDVRRFAGELAERLVGAYPKDLTLEARIANRKGRVYIDTARNGFGQTVVAPYSVRRRSEAPISTPLDWAEVTPSLESEAFTMANFSGRLEKRDPWANFFQRRQSIQAAIRGLRRL